LGANFGFGHGFWFGIDWWFIFDLFFIFLSSYFDLETLLTSLSSFSLDMVLDANFGSDFLDIDFSLLIL